MANVKVILREDVEKLGVTGEIVAVRQGYARNFLLPRRLADEVGGQVEKQRLSLARKADRRALERAEAFKAAVEVLNGKNVELLERAYKEQLYGSVTTTHIAKAILEQFQVKVDSRLIKLDHPLREIGTTDVLIQLSKDLSATVKVVIKAQVVAGEEDSMLTEEELEAKVIKDVEAAEQAKEAGSEPTGRKAQKRRRKEEKAKESAGAEGAATEEKTEAKSEAKVEAGDDEAKEKPKHEGEKKPKRERGEKKHKSEEEKAE